MKIIAACDKNWAIGKDNRLLVSIPADMKRFKALTTGNVIIAGRKTLATFPGGLPLPDRTNIIMSRDAGLTIKGARMAHSLDELKELLKGYDTGKVFVVGGETIYSQLLGMCDHAYITKIDYEYKADAYFPNLDEDPDWEITHESDEHTYFDLEYRFIEYKRKNRPVQ